MLFDEGKGKFVTVRYSRSGGTRSLDVPLLLTKQELIEEGIKHSFQMAFLKLEIRLIIHLTEHVSVAKLLIKSKTVMDKKSRFTVKGYFECFKLSRVQLYPRCRRWDHSDDDDIPLKSMLEPSTSSSNKGKLWLQNITTQLENERKMWRKLKADQEEEEKKC